MVYRTTYVALPRCRGHVKQCWNPPVWKAETPRLVLARRRWRTVLLGAIECHISTQIRHGGFGQDSKRKVNKVVEEDKYDLFHHRLLRHSLLYRMLLHNSVNQHSIVHRHSICCDVRLAVLKRSAVQEPHMIMSWANARGVEYLAQTGRAAA
jgi:hypothetical protein